MNEELDGFGNLVPSEKIVCAGWCLRRGPQVQLVDSVDQVTCRDCIVERQHHHTRP